MSYCEKCGHRLIFKENGIDGKIPYCDNCGEFRYPAFNSAVSAIVMNPLKTKILLIQQYGKTDNILVAGYITKGENAKQTLIREVKEETGLDVVEYIYNDNEYYEKTNTLMHNYVAICTDDNFTLNSEVDKAAWFLPHDALKAVISETTAGYFLKKAIRDIISDF